MQTIPANEVVDLSSGARGLVHVSVFLAQAFAQAAAVDVPAPRAMAPAVVQLVRGPRRADIAKCCGDHLPSCGTCMRRLAVDAGVEQQWLAPAINNGACALYASQERYGELYSAGK
ncbi:hypothetical protein [Rugamonas sp.]|uniref:hypothetical protein n=1 Tax=Rugamonas sp. TaxID=1926287 RepID=UPI0025F54A18|nr:hypothetical protein [Rugamonas sp.]